MENINKAKSYTPTDAMRNNARRGLALREKWNRGGLSTQEAGSQGIGSGVARAKNIINDKLTLETVKRMHSFFERHEKNYKPKEKAPDGGPKAGEIAWLLWGGSAGRSWARGILREEGILKSYLKEITKAELETEDQIFGVKLAITKSTNEELKQVTYVAMLPDSTDLHGDFTSAEEVRKAMESFNRSSMRANLFHMAMTDTFSVVESYLAPTEFILGDNLVKKGTWLMTLQVHDDKLWELVKSGDINGISIGAVANVEDTEDSED